MEIKFQPVILNDCVYYSTATIADAFSMQESAVRYMIEQVESSDECVQQDNLFLVPWRVFMRLRLPQERNLIYLVHGYKFGKGSV